MADGNILGPTVGLDAGNAADVLAQRQVAAQQNAGMSLPTSSFNGPAATEGAVDQALSGQAFHPSDSGRISWSAPPSASLNFNPDAYEAMRHTGQPVGGYNVPAASAVNASVLNPYSDRGNGDPRGGYSPPLEDAFRSSPSSSASYSSFDEARQRAQDIEADARHIYSQRGDFARIGTPDFQREVQSVQADAGLAVHPDQEDAEGAARQAAMDRSIRLHDLKTTTGFAALQMGEEGGRLYGQINSGRYLSPEQRETAEAGMLPSAGGMVGAGVGMAFGSPMLGGLIGAGAGSAAQGVIGGNEENAQAIRQAATMLATSLGEAANSVGTFRAQIEATGAPTQQLQAALGVAGSVGTFSATGTVSGLGALTNAMGDTADQAFATIARYTSSPLMHGAGNRFSSGSLDSGDITSLGFDAAEQGDFAGLKTLQTAAAKSRGANDPDIQRLAAMKNVIESSPANRAMAWLGGELSGHNPLTETNDEITRRQGQLAGNDPAAAAQNALVNQFVSLDSQRIVAQAGISAAGAGIGLVEARGGGAAQAGAASQGLYAELGAARNATQSEIGLLQGDLADPLRSAGRADELRARIATDQARLTGYDVAEAQQRRSVFGQGLSEEESRFSLFATKDSLTGASASSMLGGYNRQAEFLSGTAAGPRNPLSLTERAGIEESAARMRYSAAQGVYAQENAGLDITRAGREGAVSRAETLGGPMDVYGAQIGALQTDRDQIALNNSQVARGNMTFAQVQGVQRQNAVLATDLATGGERARVGAYDAQGGILSDTQGADRALFSRDLGVNGNRAFATENIFGDDASQVALYAGAEAGSPQGSPQRARFGRLRAGASARQVEDQDEAYSFRQGQGERVSNFQDEGAFHRALLSPYMDGPDSNPLTRGNAVLGDKRRTLREEEAALASTPRNSPTYEANAQRIEDTKNQIASLQHEQMVGMFGALPEGIIGGAGSGVMAGIVPTAAMAARYTSNPTFGSFGPGAAGPVSTMGAMTPGGQAGGFQNQGGVSEIVAALNHQTDVLARAYKDGKSGPSNYAGAGYATKFNPQRPPM